MPKFVGTVDGIVFRSDDDGWTVISFTPDGAERIDAVGVLPFLKVGDRVILEGERVTHRDYGEQIRVDSCELTRPETREAVEKYLGSGLIKGMGPKTAKLVVARFGARTLDVLEAEPERLTEVPGIGPKRARRIIESFVEQNETRRTLIFLQGAGLTPAMSMKVYRAYGAKAEAVLRRNPYRLADEIEGVGFQTADRIARDMGFAEDSSERLRSGVRYVLGEAVNRMGHMYLPWEELRKGAAETLNVPEALAERTIEEMTHEGGLAREEVDGARAVYLPEMLRAEREAARLLAERLRQARAAAAAEDVAAEIEDSERGEGVSLSAQQRAAVERAVGEGIAIITGGPGTGKTTSINCILRILEARGKVELCAPTGRAAKRMSEVTGRPARTIHRMLEYAGDVGGFQKDEDDPLDADAVVVDEVSMVDIRLLLALLRALRPGAKLVLVGDADQLPSVGAGNVLHDLIASGALPVAQLTEIFRQSGESHIVVNAHRINRGEYPIIRNRDTDFFLERREEAEAAAESVVGLAQRRLPKYLGVDSLRGIQVLAPMKKGALGVLQLNEMLQAALNPPGRDKPELERGATVFRLGDKVMQVKNDYDLAWQRDGKGGAGVFNGDIGYIVQLDRTERTLTVEFDDGRRAEYDDAALGELEHSYCISVHKSQGSEFDAVVLPLLSGPPMLMTRNLLYTAVTRARRLVVIVGRESCVHRMVDNDHIQQRYSALAQRLREFCAEE